MIGTHPKRIMFGYMAETAKALSSPARVEILDLLAQGERSVESIAAATCLSVANASQHLQLLRRAGILSVRKKGNHTLHRLVDDQIFALLRIVREFTERHIAEADQALSRLYRHRDPIEPVTREELSERMKSGAVLIDVRPEVEFSAAHIPGAINIPLEQLAGRLAELPPDQEIVAYCRGPYCVFAYEALEILRPAGLRARRLLGGFFEWRGANLPVTQSAQHEAPHR
jgi:rhodanese-related sulfurtransferase/DNA-binding transcriptional ArsR family regulator